MKKPAKMTLRDTTTRLEELNNYLPRLPSIAEGVEGATPANVALGQPELYAILQQMVSKSWEDHFGWLQMSKSVPPSKKWSTSLSASRMLSPTRRIISPPQRIPIRVPMQEEAARPQENVSER